MENYFKSFRGMGSIGAMNKGSADRYFQTKFKKICQNMCPKELKELVKVQRHQLITILIYKLIGGLKSSMGYLGSKKIIKFKKET